MAKKMFFVGTLGAALAVLIAGCDLSGLINNANGGGGFDNALVGTWHLSRTDADNGRDAAFTFTSDGRLTGDIARGFVVNVATSGGRISATVGGVDSGSADYNVADGTELTFSNLSSGSGINYFSALAGRSYYKPAGSGGNGDGKNGGSGENGGNGSNDGKGGNDDKADDPTGENGAPGGSSNPFLGAWGTGDGYSYLVIEDSTWEIPGVLRGTYTYSGTEARFTATHQWVGKGQEGVPEQIGPSGESGTPAWSVDDEYWAKIDGGEFLFTAKVSGDRLVMTFEGSDSVLTRDSGGGYPGGNDMLDPLRPDPAYPDGDAVPEMPADPPKDDEAAPGVPGQNW